MAAWSREMKFSVFLAVTFLASTALVPTFVWATRGEVGVSCIDNDGCRSRLCLDEDPTQTRFPGGSGLKVDGQRGYCTAVCDEEACPEGYSCVAAHPFRHGESDQREQPQAVQVCVRK